MSRVKKLKMKSKKWRPVILVVGVIFLALSIFIVVTYFRTPTIVPVVMLEVPPQDALYRSGAHTDDNRVEDLLSRMSLREKIAQMVLVEKNSVHILDDITTYGIGAMLSGMGAKPTENNVKGWREMITSFREKSLQSRLGIPILYGIDAIHGHSNLTEATIFPHMIGLGATGDEKLVERVARATGQELMATGIYWSYSPTLDMPQDIRWGRTYETFSDDPTLVAKLGSAYVRGLQNSDNGSSTLRVLSTLKHYVGVGSMAWDTSSNKNFHIDQGTTEVNENALKQEYLPPFKAAVLAGAGSVMVGLNSWGNTKLSAEKYLITDVLKGELKFQGFVVSDWYGVYEISGGEYRAAVTAINAGVDMVMLPFDYQTFIANVSRAVSRGEVKEERINDAVRRILRAKFAVGLFDEPRSGDIAVGVVGGDAHRALAREAVQKSLVLLKDDENILPIKQNVRTIRVAGSSADNVGRQSGAWTVEWQGIDGNWLPQSTSILSGIKARAGKNVLVEYNQNGNFSTTTPLADLGIAVVGEAPYAEGWGDNANPTLSPPDLNTIRQLKSVCKKVIVILVSGRPLIITDEVPSWDALVMAWLPGSEGQGVADVLFGDVPFTGNLPLPWPESVAQVPIETDGSTQDGMPPLFPRYFGHN